MNKLNQIWNKIISRHKKEIEIIDIFNIIIRDGNKLLTFDYRKTINIASIYFYDKNEEIMGFIHININDKKCYSAYGTFNYGDDLNTIKTKLVKWIELMNI